MKLVVKIQTHKQYLILSGILGVKDFISRHRKIEEIISEEDDEALGIRIENNRMEGWDEWSYYNHNYNNYFKFEFNEFINEYYPELLWLII